MAKPRKPWWGAGPHEDFCQNVVQRFRRFDDVQRLDQGAVRGTYRSVWSPQLEGTATERSG